MSILNPILYLRRVWFCLVPRHNTSRNPIIISMQITESYMSIQYLVGSCSLIDPYFSSFPIWRGWFIPYSVSALPSRHSKFCHGKDRCSSVESQGLGEGLLEEIKMFFEKFPVTGELPQVLPLFLFFFTDASRTIEPLLCFGLLAFEFL